MSAKYGSGRNFRIVTRALALTAILTATGFAATPAAAWQKKLPTKSKAAAPAPAIAAPYQPRVFKINDVLAKIDGAQGRREEPADWPLRLASLTPGEAASDAALPGLKPKTSSAEPFGLVTFRAPEGALWVKWRGLETDLKSESYELARCRAGAEPCSPAGKKLAAMIEAVATHTERRVETANRLVNAAVRYTSDLALHGVADRWTAPIATMTSAAGDCEDYAIAKYVVLREAGVAAQDLRLVLVRDRMARQDHAVLAVREGGRWIMLDNRHDVLMENADAPHFVPLFALDNEGVKLFAVPYASAPNGDAFAAAAERSSEFRMIAIVP